MKIAFIGGGAMGEAMLAAVLAKGLSTPESIAVSDIDQARCRNLEESYRGVVVGGDNLEAAREADIIILAIKPQHLVTVMAELKGQIKAGQLVVSIIAGARLNTLLLGLGCSAIVRVMPNTPARVGWGISVWTATREVTPEQRAWMAGMLGAMGRELYVADEKYLDMATAISGSGPAYFFYMIEALVKAGNEIGLPLEVAQELVLQTMLGAGYLVLETGQAPADLRRMVTSPGGTTAAALRRLEEGGFPALIRGAVRAAYERAQELGG